LVNILKQKQMETENQILSELSSQMGYAIAFDKPLDKKDWAKQQGVLLTVKETDVFRQMLVGKLNKSWISKLISKF